MHNSPREWILQATRYRYTFPVLAELMRDAGCKFVTLVRRLEASDRAIRQALDYLVAIGWVERNPGYGHPARPEYLLTSMGEYAAIECLRIWDELVKWNQREVAFERWPLPVLLEIGKGGHRFGEFLSALQSITPKALSVALERLISAGLANRSVVSDRPPWTRYSCTTWGGKILDG